MTDRELLERLTDDLFLEVAGHLTVIVNRLNDGSALKQEFSEMLERIRDHVPARQS